MSRPARSPSSRSGSAACPRRRRPGTVSSASTGGDALESVCIPRSRRWGSARQDLTRCGTSTPPLSVCSTAHAPICTPSSTTSLGGFWRGAWADTFAPVNSVAVLLEASRGATHSASTPVVLADAGVENVNAQVDALIAAGVLRRLLAFTELKFSNSMIEAWWRSLKHQWLFLHPLDSVATIRRLVAFYVHEHNHVLPHSAFRGQTPDEMYFGTGDAVPADLMARVAAARQARVEANRSASCKACPSLNAAA